MDIKYISVNEITPYEKNAKKHPDEQVEHIANSIREFGFQQPLVIDKNNVLVIGHGRLMAAKELGMDTVPCVCADDLTDEQIKALRLADNKTNESEWDFDLLDTELGDILDIDMSDFGFDITEYNFDDVTEYEPKQLSDEFIVPPFDIFDGRLGHWLDRKKEWNNKIGDVGQARPDAEANENDGFNKPNYKVKLKTGTSILDPVLSEIVLKWFTPYENSNVFDCFAGDTVFGYVSGSLGHTFTGIELRQEQVDFNSGRTDKFNVTYICDDGRNVDKYLQPNSQDLFFSCPPYYDLEVYSDDPKDASNQDTYEDFYMILDDAFTKACKCLADNRFAVVVCGDIRDKRGAYYNFPNDIIQTFNRNGLVLYNNIKLLTPYGNAHFRARRYMRSRKTVHVYQDVLVFYKGDTKEIKSIFPEIEVKDEGENMEF